MADDEPDDQPSTTLEVDDEMFSVRPGELPNSYDYTWLSGPNEGYGFSSRDSSPRTRTLEDHRESIRVFLAQVSPQTGHIEDGPPDPALWLREYEGLGLAEAQARAEAEGRRYRVIGPDTVVTLDYRIDRLNLIVDADGNLTEMRVG